MVLAVSSDSRASVVALFLAVGCLPLPDKPTDPSDPSSSSDLSTPSTPTPTPPTLRPPPEDTATDPTPPTTLTEPPCDIAVAALFPEDDAVDVFGLSEVRATLSLPDPLATLVVADASGEVVPGILSNDGTTLIWRGELLAPSTEYYVLVEHACAIEDFAFTTSDVGPPLSVDPLGYTFAFDASAVWLESDVVRDVLVGGSGSWHPMLFSLADLGGGSLEWLVAQSDGVLQDPCVPTARLSAGRFSDPVFVANPSRWSFELGTSATATVEGVELVGGFDAAATRFQGELRGSLDTRDLGEQLDLGTFSATGGGGVCEILETLSIACVPCEDGEPLCVPLVVGGIDALRVGSPVVERTVADIAADPTCN